MYAHILHFQNFHRGPKGRNPIIEWALLFSLWRTIVSCPEKKYGQGATASFTVVIVEQGTGLQLFRTRKSVVPRE